MKKSFKRALAVLLAALMMVFSAPFSALAYSADETPNFGLVFNAFTLGTKYFTGINGTATKNLNLRGVKEMPLSWSNKTLTAYKSIAEAGGLGTRYGKSDDSYQLKNGDYFTMTITLDNVETIYAGSILLNYEGVEPATVYSFHDEEETYDTYLTTDPNDSRIADIEGEGLTPLVEEFAPAGLPIQTISAGSTYFAQATGYDYVGMRDLQVTNADDGLPSVYYPDDNQILMAMSTNNDDHSTLTPVNAGTAKAPAAKNPETGENGYIFTYRAPVATYLFKVTDASNINFTVADGEAGFDTFIQTDTTLTSMDDTIYYSKRADATTEYVHGAALNFLGSNPYADSQPEPTYPTVTIKTPNGDLTYTADATTTTYTVPDLDDYAKEADADYHYSAPQWKDNKVPSGTFGTEDETFEIEVPQEAHSFSESTTPATCVAEGSTTYTCTCGYEYSTPISIDPTAHNWGAWAIDEDSWNTVTDNQVQANNSATATVTRVCANDATHTQTENATVTVTDYTASTEQAGGSVTFTATYGGETVGTKTVDFEALPHTHVWSAEKVATGVRQEATCVAAGYYEVAYQCTVCGDFDETSKENVEIPIDADAHPAAAIENRDKVDATCTEAGHEAGTYCTACNTWVTGGTVIPAKNHDFTGAIDINWTKDGDEWTATGVQHCKNDASHTTPVEVVVTKDVTPAEKGKEGKIVWTAKVNGEVQDTKEETIEALKIKVTVGASDLGTVVGDIASTGAEVTKEFDLGKKYTIQAVPAEGANFLGWEINGKFVSQSETYTGTAYTDTTITPVYQEATEGKINVYFYDKYGNVIKAFENVTADDYQAAVANEIPQGLDLAGYEFKGYDVADDEIKANTESATYWAVYEKKADALYTVNAPGATIEAAAGDVDGETATNVPYDTKVTVSSDSANAWKIGDEIVAYGTSYTFFVGADVTVTPVADAEVKTNVAIIGTTKSHPSYTVLATRTAGNATIVERGWIYGKVDAASEAFKDIDVAQATSGLRIKRGPVTQSEQFSLTFKINNTGTTVNVAAFVVDSNGNVTYSAVTPVEA